jgi:PBSX family phage portal protein
VIKPDERPDENVISDVRVDTRESPVVTAESLAATDIFLSTGDALKSLVGPKMKRKINTVSKRYEGTEGTGTKRIDNGLTAYGLFDVVQPPFNMAVLSSFYEQNVHHFAAVNAKTYNTVGLGYDFKPTSATTQKLDDLEGKTEQLNKFRKKLERIKQEHFEWLDSLNQEDTIVEILIKFFKDYDALGIGYLEIGRTTRGEIAYLGHIPAATMRVRRLRDGYVQIAQGNKAVFFRNFGETDYPDPINKDPQPNEVICFKKYAPNNDFYGVPDVIPAVGSVLGSRFATLFNLDYFENKAVPRHMIVVKGATLSTAAEQAMYEFFDVKLKGKHHRTLYVPLPADDPDRKVEIEIKPIEAGIQDASFIKYKDNNRDEILAAHRTPITKITLLPGVSLAAARDADKTFKEQVTRPLQDLIEKRVNMIVKEKSDVFLFSLNELSLTDEDTQSKIDERYLRMQVIVPNEVRARMGMPGIDGGDKVVDLKPATGSPSPGSQRASERSANSPDKSGEARQPKGEGRAAP